MVITVILITIITGIKQTKSYMSIEDHLQVKLAVVSQLQLTQFSFTHAAADVTGVCS